MDHEASSLPTEMLGTDLGFEERKGSPWLRVWGSGERPMTQTVLTGLITWAGGQPQNRVMKEAAIVVMVVQLVV